ncbi:MotA/TolQ/ExbB proton channel family protein [Beggiatoa leptomitoformis]|uniref:Biopolymer transport protein ExbB n=1 Tax=Beggiatoa leptomitoformis TaxID=288004 RepID=A0A2N9YC39_9GAMM|nr:MotA/TolQ/ExbB proton channel family protein [Beggiatoa leptomitoformis]ALG66672.1 MotA/TolQ/ExbB proton channel family protein [Beggiatoa leptomitoformis]AUI68002.1 MotA/TolQ/ExbB proton channel family protein [Beggiatoa leptomitoformis]
MQTSHFGIDGFLLHVAENPLALTIGVILLFMSLLSWYLLFSKTITLIFIKARTRRFRRQFEKVDSLQALNKILRQEITHDPFSRLTLHGIQAAVHHERIAPNRANLICSHSEFITRAMRRIINKETESLKAGLSILASIASTAPFIGLLGTVLGIYGALMQISSAGSASLETVAAPVGEALIMTAIGLAVAIPAVLGYNALVRGYQAYFSELDAFAHDLYAYLNTGDKVMQQLGALPPQPLTLQEAA